MGKIGVWDGAAGSQPAFLSLGKDGPVSSVDFALDSEALLATGERKWAGLWKMSASALGAPLASMAAPLPILDLLASAPVFNATFSGDGRLLALLDRTPVVLVAASRGGKVPFVSLKHQTDPVRLASFSPDSSMLASSDDRGRVYLWDLWSAPEQVPEPVLLSGHRRELATLEWSPDGNFLVSAGEDGEPLVWQFPQDRLMSRIGQFPYFLPNHPGGVTAVAISPDAKRVATAGADRLIRVSSVAPTARGTFRTWSAAVADPKERELSKESASNPGFAILSWADARSGEYSQYFRPAPSQQIKGNTYRLNPESLFLNARWDYSISPRSVLRGAKVRIRKLGPDQQPMGPVVEAQPIDWGPPEGTGFAFELSPGVIKELKLSPSNSVELEIPLLLPKQAPQAKN